MSWALDDTRLTPHFIQGVQTIQHATTLQEGGNKIGTPLKPYKCRETCTQRQEFTAITVSFDTVPGQTEHRQTCEFLGQWPQRGPLPFQPLQTFMTSECLHFQRTKLAAQSRSTSGIHLRLCRHYQNCIGESY